MSHWKEIVKLKFRALALRQSEIFYKLGSLRVGNTWLLPTKSDKSRDHDAFPVAGRINHTFQCFFLSETTFFRAFSFFFFFFFCIPFSGFNKARTHHKITIKRLLSVINQSFYWLNVIFHFRSRSPCAERLTLNSTVGDYNQIIKKTWTVRIDKRY